MARFGRCAWVLGSLCLGPACGSDGNSPASSSDGGTGGTGAGNGGSGSSGRGNAGAPVGGSSNGGAGQGGRASGTGGAAGGASSAGGQSGGGQPGAGGSPPGGAGGAIGGTLPEGNTGIAARHPGDVGIEGDSAVIYADDFETYSQASDLDQNWNAGVYQRNQIRIATETANVFAGGKALEFTVPQQTAELSNATDRTVNPELDVLHLRYYSKFLPPFDVVGSTHNGSMISAHYFINGNATPGVRANGTNKFLVNLEHWRGEAATPSPGHLNVYVYHPAQRDDYGDHFFPTGLVMPNTSLPFDFGSNFVSRPDILPALDRWYCYEYMVQANTPNQLDGRIAIWVDGALAADFQNLRFRDIDTLKIDRFGLSFHVRSNPNGETKKWYDNVVAATSYIGPMVPP